MSNNTGGPAFPNQVRITDEAFAELRGMTLRDYFAAKAMQADMQSMPGMVAAEIARRAYEQADAMLKARGA